VLSSIGSLGCAYYRGRRLKFAKFLKWGLVSKTILNEFLVRFSTSISITGVSFCNRFFTSITGVFFATSGSFFPIDSLFRLREFLFHYWSFFFDRFFTYITGVSFSLLEFLFPIDYLLRLREFFTVGLKNL